MKNILILTILLIGTFLKLNAQTDSISSYIIGKWQLVKHTLPVNGKAVNKLTSNESSVFEFRKDGTYTNTFNNKSTKEGPCITVGKWKVSADGKQIDTFENKFFPPWNKNAICADHPLLLVKFTQTEFVTKECMYSEDPAGTSYYKKQ